jgi:hypothetical protein
MAQITEHPARRNRTWIRAPGVATATTTMGYVDPTKIDPTSGGVERPRLLAKQSFCVSPASPGYIVVMARPNALQLAPQRAFWRISLGRVSQFHSDPKPIEEQAGCLGDTIEIIFSSPLLEKSSDPESTTFLGEGFIFEGGERSPEWLSRTEEAIESLLTLPENWDSYDARVIEVRAVRAAIELLRSIVQLDTPQPIIVPTNRGGIQIEWHTRGIDLEIETTADREVRVLYENPQENAEEEFELGSDLKPLTDLTAKLSHPGSNIPRR